TGSTYVGAGHGFGEVAMQIVGGEEHGIDMAYGGDDEQLQNRASNLSNDDGSEYPVHFNDNDRDGKLSAGDQFLVYGSGNAANGPAADNWRLDIHFDRMLVGSALLNDYDSSDVFVSEVSYGSFLFLHNKDNSSYIMAAMIYEDDVDNFELEPYGGTGWFLNQPGNYSIFICFGNHTSCDGVNDTFEFSVSEGWEGYHTDPNDIDTDDDGLTDGYEVFTSGTDPNDWDTDWDGLNDGEEVMDYGTYANDSDSDDDGLSDLEDIERGLDPLSPDTDSDGIGDFDDECHDTPEGEEANEYGCSASQRDTDDDGFTDAEDVFPEDPDEWIDSDNDTFGDNGDAFPDNPNEWADSDGDRVGDNSDECSDPLQLLHFTDVDDVGCGLSQLDSDSDGVHDGKDDCPDSAPDAKVDEYGCIPKTVVEDEGLPGFSFLLAISSILGLAILRKPRF
ncbi:MAG: hypothetical protein NZ770_05430, partial [Candidatus Poseidoniaceae archaeon]|nr:hypothetical protein [Candidatus Poseidoniaceae archaeon]